MKPRQFDPLRLDVAAFAAEGATLAGHWPMSELPRLNEAQPAASEAPTPELAWSVQGEQQPVKGAEPEVWLRLGASGTVWLTCQRCLQPFQQPLAVQRRLRFVRDEAQAEALDAELEDDVLAMTRSLNLRELIEDELLLELPLVPRHAQCPQPLPMSAGDIGDEDDDEAPENPFAALKALKRRTPS